MYPLIRMCFSEHEKRGKVGNMAKELDNEERISRKEAQIPRLAKLAVKKAYFRALNAGQKVLVVDAGVLYEVSKEGRRRVKSLRPPVPVKAGKIIKLS